MYDVLDYASMAADRHRVDAYARALGKVVRPGDVVIDIGAGTGILSLLACRAGASRVYAIEPDDAIAVARENAVANGYADRITFIQDISTRVTPPETADVVVSDLHGVLPGYQGHLPTIIDARQRFLSPGGRLVPQQDALMMAAVSAADLHASHAGVADINGLDMQAARKLTVNTWSKTWLTSEQLLSKPRCWALLDYSEIDDSAIQGDVRLEFDRSGIAHGFGVWFESVLAKNVELSNAPGAPKLNYGNAYFPWPEPVEVQTGDVAHVLIQATLVRSDYVWRWETRILNGGREDAIDRQFSQSTFFGAPLCASRLRKCAPDYVPKLTEDGEIASMVLELMADGNSLGQVAKTIASRFPKRFSNWKAALDHIGELSRQYS
ncbi:MAG: 50S ribosomal protein L11 methyltransferase [Gammaproteobacteria bacterium]|nr:50S ribosomal protein L11 methyltransferase [Gammaproteobacteria bacterium]MDH3411995.1 50S ribosomal protein L11 methyltransferase [Gammaproteobacteria bacterium]